MTDDNGLNRGVRSIDVDSIQRAIQTLRDAGFAVDAIDDAQDGDHGVRFSLDVYDPNRAAGLRDTGRERLVVAVDPSVEYGGGTGADAAWYALADGLGPMVEDTQRLGGRR